MFLLLLLINCYGVVLLLNIEMVILFIAIQYNLKKSLLYHLAINVLRFEYLTADAFYGDAVFFFFLQKR